MDGLYVQRCAGIDIGKRDVKVCVRVPSRKRGQRHSEVRTFAATSRGLAELRGWLAGERIELVAMESTGCYWKPVYHALEDQPGLRCWLANATAVKTVPGRKSDVSDARWLAQLTEHGLIRPSLVPPPAIRRLRDLTRERTTLGRDKTRVTARLHAVLEDAGIKLSCVASDILGVSGRAILAALIEGQRDPQTLAQLARRRLRRKLPDLIEALSGHFADHHARQCARLLTHIDFLDTQIGDLAAAVDHAITDQPQLTRARDLLITIPDVATQTAEIIIAETGADMTRFATAAHLASWAGLCPGHHESAGRHRSGRTRHGNTWLRGALGNAAAAASRTSHTHLAGRYRRIAGRRGKHRALVAVAHTILVAAWHMLTTNTDYREPTTPRTDTRRRARRAAQLTHQLHALGYTVTIQEAV